MSLCNPLRSCYEINYTDCAGWFFEIKEENVAVPGYGEAFSFYGLTAWQMTHSVRYGPLLKAFGVGENI